MPKTCELSATNGQENCAAWLTAFKDYLQARSLDPKTISSYVQDMQMFQKRVGKHLASVTRDELQAVQTQWQREGASDATLRRRMAAFRNFYGNFLNAGGYITKSPTANVRTPKGWARVPRAPAANDLERVIAAIGHDDPFQIRDRAILLLFRDSGPRVSAVAHLLLSDVDIAGRCLTIRKDKFGKQHQAPLSKRTAQAIQEYINKARPYFLRDRISPYLFLGYHRKRAANANGPMIRQQLFNIATGWSKKILGVASSPHKWRAACFTECAEKEMDVFDLMNLAGHASPEVTQGYIRHQLGHLKQAYRETHPRALRTPSHDPK